ncbi:MAG: hypothetical protein HDQ95_16645 [Roseburia sp.]|nr:hypothetical protein [Roseburia sp.]
MNRVEDFINMTKLNEILSKREEAAAEEKKANKVVWIFAVIGIVVALAAAIYGIYRFFTPDYLEDFEDDFEDDFDDDFEDDFFEDDEEKPEEPAKKDEPVKAEEKKEEK